MTAAVTARWEGFLAQVRDRFLAVLREGQEGCPALLEQVDWDPVPMSNAWHAIQTRAEQLSHKIDDTWNEQVEGAFEQAGAPPPAVAHERAKGAAMRDWMELEVERTRIGVFAGAGRAFYERAVAEHRTPFACTRCGAPQRIPFTFRALDVTCPHCGTVNGFEPGTRMRMGESFLHNLCEEAALPQLVALHEADRARKRARPLRVEHLKAWERANIAFYHAYLSARAHYLPDTAPSLDHELRARMRGIYDALAREGVWTMAGSPADLR